GSEAGADGVAFAGVAGDDEGGRHAANRDLLVVVGVGVAALHVEQARTPGVADTAGDRAEAALVVGVGDAAREHRADAAGEPGILAFDADHEVRVELPVRTDLHAAEETAVAVVAGGEAAELVVAGERAADMAT